MLYIRYKYRQGRKIGVMTKLKISQHDPTKNQGWTPEGEAVPAPHVAPVMLLLLQNQW
jgi:hypothetical protein